MKEIILTSRQQMLPPDIFAYEFGLFPTPKKIENTKIATYVLIGVLVTMTLGLISYRVYQIHQENKSKKLN